MKNLSYNDVIILAVFPNLTGKKRICNSCNSTRVGIVQKEIRKEGGPRLERLRKQNAEAVARYKLKHN